MLVHVLKNAWELYRRHFVLIATVIVVIWLPLELLSSYMDAFVFDPDDLRRSFKFNQFLENFVGIIATAAVFVIVQSSRYGQRETVGSALGAGLQAWGRMWWTRFLTMVCIVLGLVLLVVPGLYLSIRLALVEPIAVCEHVSGPTALKRSFELTNGKFWKLVGLGLAVVGILLVPLVALLLPVVLIEELDHWLVDAGTSLILDVVIAYGTLCTYVLFERLSVEVDAAKSEAG